MIAIDKTTSTTMYNTIVLGRHQERVRDFFFFAGVEALSRYYVGKE